MAAALPRVPLPVLAVQAAGFLQSVYLLKKKPWSKDPRGAWALRGVDVTRANIGSPQLLLAYRATALLFIVALGAYQVHDRGFKVFAFYTVWSWWLLAAFFALASAASYLALRKKRPNVNRLVSRLEHAVVVFFHMNLTTVLIVDILTWTVLWPMLRANPDPKTVQAFRFLLFNFISYSQHGINALLMLGELLLNNIPVVPYMLGYVGLWSSVYGGWALYHYMATGRWLYPFLDAMQSWSPFAYLGLFLTHWLFFGMVILLYKLKLVSWTQLKAASKQA
ncbi:hypothetical protein WJX72_001650 [[Myrmecia] bisecta]|uniref:Uncharacterized protein n=1 Tax=[Myrmecia] bisecta TaxID=41462 RepID=A0AAW1PWX6_9CHLO